MQSEILTPNSLSFIALSNEYCQAVEGARESEREEFVDTMLRLLPRLYITAADLSVDPMLLTPELEDLYIESSLSEEYYEAARLAMEQLMGPDDIYLEVFEQDMKYSDTPISASISEQLADLFQPLYNFTEMVKNVPTDLLPGVINAEREEFRSYWSQILCNVLRALNHLRYNAPTATDESMY